MVLNAFIWRGYKVAATQGNKIVLGGGFPRGPATALPILPLATQVEDYD